MDVSRVCAWLCGNVAHSVATVNVSSHPVTRRESKSQLWPARHACRPVDGFEWVVPYDSSVCLLALVGVLRDTLQVTLYSNSNQITPLLVTASFTYRMLAPVLLASLDLVVTADAVSVLERAGLDMAVDHEGKLRVAKVVRIHDWQAICRNSEVVVPLDLVEALLSDGCLTCVDVVLHVLPAQIGITPRDMSKVRIKNRIVIRLLVAVFPEIEFA